MCRTTFVTAVAAIYAELGISLPFVPGYRKGGYKPDAVLVIITPASQPDCKRD